MEEEKELNALENVEATEEKDTVDENVKEENAKTFTQEEVNKIISSRIKKAIEKEREHAKLTEEERKAVIAKEQEEEIRKREEAINLRENNLLAQEKLTASGLNKNLAKLVVHSDVNVMTKNIEILIKEWNKAINEGVENRLKGTPPKAPEDNKNIDITKLHYGGYQL